MSLWDAIDAAEVTATKKEFSLLPEGDYKAQITDVEAKEELFPKDQLSFNIEFTITEGEYTGRKCWWSSKISSDSTPKALTFVKSYICKAAGIESTKGNPAEALQSAKGNYVEINVQHKPGVKDPSKTYLNVYIN